MKIAALNQDGELVYIIHFYVNGSNGNVRAVAVDTKTGKLMKYDFYQLTVIDRDYR